VSSANIIAQAFLSAAERYPELRRAWINTSIEIGGKVPASKLTESVQRIGELDMLLRSMEDDFFSSDTEENHILALQYQVTLSEFWIGAMYEVVRLLKGRNLGHSSKEFSTLAHDLRLVCIPLEKHEIAADEKLTAPLKMTRNYDQGRCNDIYIYDKKDPARARINPMGISKGGSVAWHVIDIAKSKTYWIERRKIADTVLKLWPKN
jgi:hypothetical protein